MGFSFQRDKSPAWQRGMAASDRSGNLGTHLSKGKQKAESEPEIRGDSVVSKSASSDMLAVARLYHPNLSRQHQ